MYGPSYIQIHNLSNEQWKVYNQIKKCKKEEAGLVIQLLVKNVVNPSLVLIVAEIDIVLCVNLMLEKNGLIMSLLIYLIALIFI